MENTIQNNIIKNEMFMNQLVYINYKGQLIISKICGIGFYEADEDVLEIGYILYINSKGDTIMFPEDQVYCTVEEAMKHFEPVMYESL